MAGGGKALDRTELLGSRRRRVAFRGAAVRTSRGARGGRQREGGDRRLASGGDSVSLPSLRRGSDGKAAGEKGDSALQFQRPLAPRAWVIGRRGSRPGL